MPLNPEEYAKVGEQGPKKPLEKKDTYKGVTPRDQMTVTQKRAMLGQDTYRHLRPAQRAELKARIAMLYADDEFLDDIAEVINEEFGFEGDASLDVRSVRYYVRKQVEYWRKISVANIEVKQAAVLERINQIEQLALEGYYASMEGKSIRKIEREIKDAKSKPRFKAIRNAVKAEYAKAKAEKREVNLTDEMFLENILIKTSEKMKEYEALEENLSGNPKFLEIILKCNQERCKIWGLYIRQADMMTQEQQFAAMDDKERTQRIAALIQSVKNRESSQNSPVEAVNSEVSSLARPAPLPKSQSEAIVIGDEQARVDDFFSGVESNDIANDND